MKPVSSIIFDLKSNLKRRFVGVVVVVVRRYLGLRLKRRPMRDWSVDQVFDFISTPKDDAK